MPGQNGFQLTRAITRDPRYADVPMIMCTSKNQETDRVWGMRQGARDYIVKPVDADRADGEDQGLRLIATRHRDAWPTAKPCAISRPGSPAPAGGAHRAAAPRPGWRSNAARAGFLFPLREAGEIFALAPMHAGAAHPALVPRRGQPARRPARRGRPGGVPRASSAPMRRRDHARQSRLVASTSRSTSIARCWSTGWSGLRSDEDLDAESDDDAGDAPAFVGRALSRRRRRASGRKSNLADACAATAVPAHRRLSGLPSSVAYELRERDQGTRWPDRATRNPSRSTATIAVADECRPRRGACARCRTDMPLADVERSRARSTRCRSTPTPTRADAVDHLGGRAFGDRRLHRDAPAGATPARRRSAPPCR